MFVRQFRNGPVDSGDDDFRDARPAVHVAVDVRLPAEFRAAVLQHGLAETSGKVKPKFRYTRNGARICLCLVRGKLSKFVTFA